MLVSLLSLAHLYDCSLQSARLPVSICKPVIQADRTQHDPPALPKLNIYTVPLAMLKDVC